MLQLHLMYISQSVYYLAGGNLGTKWEMQIINPQPLLQAAVGWV